MVTTFFVFFFREGFSLVSLLNKQTKQNKAKQKQTKQKQNKTKQKTGGGNEAVDRKKTPLNKHLSYSSEQVHIYLFIIFPNHFRRFRLMDKDKSGDINSDELLTSIREIGLSENEIPDAMVKQLYDTFDKDGNGKITYQEFLRAMRVSEYI